MSESGTELQTGQTQAALFTCQDREGGKSGDGRLICVNPASGKIIGEVPVASAEEIEGKIELLKEGQALWELARPKERARHIAKARKRLIARMDEMMDMVIRETGKTEFDGIIEILTVAEIMRFVSSYGPRALSPEKRRMGLMMKTKRGSIQYWPHGIVGVISPWNYPLILAAGPTVQALMAGNGVLLKPSEYAPLTVLKMKEIFLDSGLPDNIVQVVIGAREVGHMVVTAPGTALVCFTGSVEVGRRIAMACAEQLKPVILELGGKDPVIVLEDANIERAARAVVWGGFNNAGQTCISVERVYVEESVADQFIGRVVELTKEVSYGPGDGDKDLGSMTTEQVADKVISQVEDAREKGARILVGGGEVREASGRFIEPTVVVDADQTMEIMQKETFGPVIAISRVKSGDEAIEQANSLDYGLNASIFSEDLRKAREVAKRIRAGNVCINDVESNYLCAALPFGGVGSSGMGRLQGIEGIRSFAQIQSVCEDRFGLNKELWWFPVSRQVTKLFRAFIKLWYG